MGFGPVCAQAGLALFRAQALTFYLAFFPGIYSGTLSDILSGNYSDILSGILFGIYSSILCGILSGIQT